MEGHLDENTTMSQVEEDVREETAEPIESESAEDSPDETIADETGQPHSDIERLIAEAEQRGYLRGRNERIEVEMRRPALLENNRTRQADTEGRPLILNHMRRSVWD